MTIDGGGLTSWILEAWLSLGGPFSKKKASR